MRITADDKTPGQRKSLLNHDLVTDALADVKEVPDAVFPDEFANRLVIGRGLLVRCRDHVVQSDHRQLGIAQAELGNVGFDLVGDRRGIVMHQEVVGLDRDDLTRNRCLEAGVPAQQFLSECHSHAVSWVS